MLKSKLFEVMIISKKNVMVESESITMLHMTLLKCLKTNVINCES